MSKSHPTPLLDVAKMRQQFPILTREDRGHQLVYFDNGATPQKPLQVIEAVDHFYRETNSNVHRSIYSLGVEASHLYERARGTVANFLHADKAEDIIFTRGTTESINLVAHSFLHHRLMSGDEVLITYMEHHANIVPWQRLCQDTGATLVPVLVKDDGTLDMEDFDAKLGCATKIVAVTHVSNVLGTINPLKELVAKAHAANTPVLVDGAQAVAHLEIDVQELDVDFYVFSGHKIYGPSGIGILYAKEDCLKHMRPYQSGGDMILRVTMEKTIYNEIPFRFEAGTPNIEGAIGLAVALEWVLEQGVTTLAAYENQLFEYALEKLSAVPGFRRIGNAKKSAAVISFVLGDAHPHDVSHELALQNIACRAGHHCAQPLMKQFKVPATTRVSFAPYNTFEEIDKLVEALAPIEEKFRL